MDNGLFHVGVKGVLKNKNTVLILKAPDPNGAYWDFPGGRVQEHETLHQALLRELTEEVPSLENITISNPIHAARLEKFKADRGPHPLIIIFFSITADFKEIVLSDEHENYRWVAKQDIPALESDPSIRLTPETEKQALLKAFETK